MVIRLTEEEERGVIAEARKEQERLGELSCVFAGEEFLKGMEESRLRKLVQTYVKAVELLYCEDKKRCRETLSFLKGEFNGILVPVPSHRVSRKVHKISLHVPTWRAVYKVLKKKVEKEIPLRMPEKVSKEDAKVWTLKYFLFSFLDEREIRETLKKNGIDLEELEFLTRRVVESAKEKGVIEWGGAQKNLLKGSIFLLKRKAGVRFEPPPKFLTEVYYGYALNCPFGEKPVEKLYFAYLQELLELCRKDKDLERKVTGGIADIHLISINEGNFPQDTPVEELVNPIRLEEALEKANSDEKLENVYRGVVRPEGNKRAQELMYKYFEKSDVNWRGIGRIPKSGLELREEYSHIDAKKVFDLPEIEEEKVPGCICDKIVLGKAYPTDCKLFGTVCTPSNPKGPCMVSGEGACNIWYRFS